MPNVLELNEQTMGYENGYRTSFCFPHRLFLGQSVGQFLKLSDDRAVALLSSRHVSLLVVVQELRDASLGGLC